jgi:hypothetical protein
MEIRPGWPEITEGRAARRTPESVPFLAVPAGLASIQGHDFRRVSPQHQSEPAFSMGNGLA